MNALPTIHVLGCCHPYHHGANPQLCSDDRLILDLKARAPHAVAFFASVLSEILPTRTYLAVVPAHLASAPRSGIALVADELIATGCWADATNWLRRRVDVPKNSAGGARNLELELASLDVDVPDDATGNGDGPVVILLDDVTTSGTSLRAGWQRLLSADVRRVLCVAVAQTVRPSDTHLPLGVSLIRWRCVACGRRGKLRCDTCGQLLCHACASVGPTGSYCSGCATNCPSCGADSIPRWLCEFCGSATCPECVSSFHGDAVCPDCAGLWIEAARMPYEDLGDIFDPESLGQVEEEEVHEAEDRDEWQDYLLAPYEGLRDSARDPETDGLRLLVPHDDLGDIFDPESLGQVEEEHVQEAQGSEEWKANLLAPYEAFRDSPGDPETDGLGLLVPLLADPLEPPTVTQALHAGPVHAPRGYLVRACPNLSELEGDVEPNETWGRPW